MLDIDIFILGAGRPARGVEPSALKHIAHSRRALDWQLDSFAAVCPKQNIHYLGGYQIEQVVKQFPQLNFTLIPNWQYHSILHTLLYAPFRDADFFISYSDTIFRPQTIEKMISIKADVVIAVDSLWQNRYNKRPRADQEIAETLMIPFTDLQDNINKSAQFRHLKEEPKLVEFTGLAYFNKKVAPFLKQLKQQDSHYNTEKIIPDLLALLQQQFHIVYFDVAGQWAEFNSDQDIARFILGTKAQTLARLARMVKKSHIGAQYTFTCQQWQSGPQFIIHQIQHKFSSQRVVVRSSTVAEDGWLASHAGGFETCLNIDSSDPEKLTQAISRVIASYQSRNPDDQVLIQAYIDKVRLAGVVFTCTLETGAPYYRFNFDDQSRATDSVTAGNAATLRTVLLSRLQTGLLSEQVPELQPVLTAVQEIEQLLGYDRLDMEFALDQQNQVHIFQVRPLTVNHDSFDSDPEKIAACLQTARAVFERKQKAPPVILGSRAIFANMPDWNPAEIIGTRPQPLAFSLYRYLVTDWVWAQQRYEFGYRDVRSCPLLLAFGGQPYVDVRASINSFIPAALADKYTQTLVNACLQLLHKHPHWHDKLEFAIIPTIWTADFPALFTSRFQNFGLDREGFQQWQQALKDITRKAFTRLRDDTQAIETLALRLRQIQNSQLSALDKALFLLDDCKRFGTLPFAHAARAGFIASAWLNSLVSLGILSVEKKLRFLSSFGTIGSALEQDRARLSKEELLQKYGHLRPGTYDITQYAYHEQPDYFLAPIKREKPFDKTTFACNVNELRQIDHLLQKLNSPINAPELFSYMRTAIQLREHCKFEFTRNVSLALDYLIKTGQQNGISRDQLAFCDIGDLKQLSANIIDKEEWQQRLRARQSRYARAHLIELPSVIKQPNNFYVFERLDSQPNFVTIKKITAPLLLLSRQGEANLSGKIILITQADPGYDWLFSHRIAALITCYGGANSHMAIRAAEMALPAAIGVGEQKFEALSQARLISLDCANQLIRILQ